MSNGKRGGTRKGAGRTPLDECEKKKGFKIYIRENTKQEILKHGKGSNFSEKAVELIASEIKNRKNK
ncbi:hypothetical protein GOQ27_14300 [Clostridium sp. D2Q-11]|uniref:Uncharacterized protein n=1 Tax=Anaeromonas frigoriresistens TaxID=2683708 RepID=A0A942V4A3_9FIRM|nr:hypothetical protein [Anaeromonas frigoriresistens]MBS4539642.1 hypothetical protein [Anaeromonas frigoriresistens]